MSLRTRAIKTALAGARGFTLLEVLLAVSITSLAVGVVGAGIFQVTSVRKFWVDDQVATRDLRHAGTLFAGDALNAEDALDGPGGARLVADCADPPSTTASAVTLTWTGAGGGALRATYSASSGTLTREDQDGTETGIIPSGVVDGSVAFTLCGNLLTLELEVEAEKDATETMRLRTYLRKLTP